MAGHDLIGYDLAFYYLDLINTALIRSLQVGQTSYMIFCQAEDRDFEKLRPGVSSDDDEFAQRPERFGVGGGG